MDFTRSERSGAVPLALSNKEKMYIKDTPNWREREREREREIERKRKREIPPRSHVKLPSDKSGIKGECLHTV